MPFKSSEVIMPPNLGDFPWVDMVHMWDLDHPWHAVRLKLWHYDPSDPALMDYFSEAFTLHLEIWKWLGERYQIPRVPEFECSGHGLFEPGAVHQTYGLIAAWSTFYVGSRWHGR